MTIQEIEKFIKKSNPDELYKVEWDDIASFVNENIKTPYTKHIAKSYTIGRLQYDSEVLLVIYSGNFENGEINQVCGDAIPVGCITNITKV